MAQAAAKVFGMKPETLKADAAESQNGNRTLAIAGRRVHTHRRSEGRRRDREARAAEDALEVVEGEDDAEELERALAQLPGHLRATVELRFVDELPHRDVARVLGVSLRTAKDWARRGVEELRRRLEGGAT